jgi:hypothetical protein
VARELGWPSHRAASVLPGKTNIPRAANAAPCPYPSLTQIKLLPAAATHETQRPEHAETLRLFHGTYTFQTVSVLQLERSIPGCSGVESGSAQSGTISSYLVLCDPRNGRDATSHVSTVGCRKELADVQQKLLPMSIPDPVSAPNFLDQGDKPNHREKRIALKNDATYATHH